MVLLEMKQKVISRIDNSKLIKKYGLNYVIDSVLEVELSNGAAIIKVNGQTVETITDRTELAPNFDAILFYKEVVLAIRAKMEQQKQDALKAL